MRAAPHPAGVDGGRQRRPAARAPCRPPLRRTRLRGRRSSGFRQVKGRVLAAAPAGVVIQPNEAEPPRLITASGEEHALALPDRHQILGLTGKRIVIHVHGHIGTTDLNGSHLIVQHHGPNGPSPSPIDLADGTTKPIDLPAEQTGAFRTTDREQNLDEATQRARGTRTRAAAEMTHVATEP